MMFLSLVCTGDIRPNNIIVTTTAAGEQKVMFIDLGCAALSQDAAEHMREQHLLASLFFPRHR